MLLLVLSTSKGDFLILLYKTVWLLQNFEAHTCVWYVEKVTSERSHIHTFSIRPSPIKSIPRKFKICLRSFVSFKYRYSRHPSTILIFISNDNKQWQPSVEFLFFFAVFREIYNKKMTITVGRGRERGLLVVGYVV